MYCKGTNYVKNDLNFMNYSFTYFVKLCWFKLYRISDPRRHGKICLLIEPLTIKFILHVPGGVLVLSPGVLTGVVASDACPGTFKFC